MNTNDWHILVTLNEEKNITKAAKRLYISQPALSYRIDKFEKEFGDKLFIKNRQGIHITPQGNYLVQHAKKMIKQMQDLKESIQSMAKKAEGTLNLGVSRTTGQYLLPNMLKDYITHFPDVTVNVTTGFNKEIEEMLYYGDIHIAILRGNRYSYEKDILLKKEPIFITSIQKIDVMDLPKLKQISYQKKSALNNIVNKWWREKFSDPPQIIMEIDNLETCKEMVRCGLGYTILPGICLEKETDFFTKPLVDKCNNSLERETRAYCYNSATQYAPVNAFLNHFENQLL